MVIEQAPGAVPACVLREVNEDRVDQADRKGCQSRGPTEDKESRPVAILRHANGPTREQAAWVHEQDEEKAEQPVELGIYLLHLEQVQRHRQREGKQQREPERDRSLAEQAANRSQLKHRSEAILSREVR